MPFTQRSRSPQRPRRRPTPTRRPSGQAARSVVPITCAYGSSVIVLRPSVSEILRASTLGLATGMRRCAADPALVRAAVSSRLGTDGQQPVQTARVDHPACGRGEDAFRRLPRRRVPLHFCPATLRSRSYVARCSVSAFMHRWGRTPCGQTASSWAS